MATTADLDAEIERRVQERLQAERSKAVSFKVGEKGGVSVYGLGRFPVTLYVEQWEALFDSLPALQTFIADNEHRLKRK